MTPRPLPAVTTILVSAALLTSCGREKSGNPGPPADLEGADAAYHHTREILSFGPRPPGSAALAKTRAYLAARLRESGWQVARQDIEGRGPQGPLTFVNLLARFGPPGEPALWTRPVKGLLGAHIDSKYFPDRTFLGADDAASAAGVILELARRLAARPDHARQLELVFFDGEEAFALNMPPAEFLSRPGYDGLYGSRYYARGWRARPDKPAFGLILDMIGHNDLRVRYPSDSPPRLVEVLRRAARHEGVADRFAPADTPIIDDHVPLNNAGIPTLDIIGDFANAPWWHTENDSLDLVSKQSLDITLRVVQRMLDHLLDQPS